MKDHSAYKNSSTIKWALIIVVISWVLFAFWIMPNLNLLRLAMFQNGHLNLKPIVNVFSSMRVRKTLLNSFLIGISVAITTNILGIFQVLMLDYFEMPGRKRLNFAYHSPLVINGMVLVLAYNFIVGNNGLLTNNLQKINPNLPNDWFLGYGAVLTELTFANTMFHITFVRDALHNVDYQTVEAAQNLGIKQSKILKKVVLPTMLPSILAATTLNFNMGLSSFATPKILGGPKFETINTLIFTFSQSQNTKNYAVVLSVFLGTITFIVLKIFTRIENRMNVVSVSKVKTKIKRQKIENTLVRRVCIFFAHLTALIQTLPPLLIIIFSLMPFTDLSKGNIVPTNFNLSHYLNVFESSGIRPVLVSISYSILAAIISVTAVMIIGRWITKYNNVLTRTLENIIMIPWFIPSTLIALGILFTYNSSHLIVGNKVLIGTVYVLLIGYIIVRVPNNLRIIKSAYKGVDNSLEEAAKNLGASSLSTFKKVIFPIMLPTALSTMLLTFIGLLSEFNLTVFLFNPMYMPLGVVINNATNTEANPQAVMLSFVYAVIIMLIASITTVLVQRIRKR